MDGSGSQNSSNPLDAYEPLEVVGTGSFGTIRKVRRRSDGVVLARKELNFERMTERDRKQIVAEVNILKELDHDHIVAYHDRVSVFAHALLLGCRVPTCQLRLHHPCPFIAVR